ncbi:MAG: RecBCD enzyme subunit RecD [marine bacterium B5-7]|nr:MAG: RecBCD enzyme subunit RecD [marine bacterium B5-7]
MTTALQMLDLMRSKEVIDDLDNHFARLMLRLNECDDQVLAVVAGLLSASSRDGHTSVPINQIRDEARSWFGGKAVEVDRLLDQLHRDGKENLIQPMVVDAGRVYLFRYFDFERRLANEVLTRARLGIGESSSDDLAASLDGLFNNAVPKPTDDMIDWQKIAVALAASKRLIIVTGGPGTGKTSMVVRLLALLIQQSKHSECHIALTAPTGKAAARMRYAIESARSELEINEDIRLAIPSEAHTIHRLLGSRRGGRGFRYCANNKLQVDVVVVDEVSMVDLELMTHLLEAIPQQTRIILLGDRDQLASVEPGSVFADLCVAADQLTDETACAIGEITRFDLSSFVVDATHSPMADTCIELKRSYRFTPASAIGRLASATNQGDAETVMSLLVDDSTADIGYTELVDSNMLPEYIDDHVMSFYKVSIELAQGGASISDVFDRYGSLSVLCALRQGPFGVNAVNALVERRFISADVIRPIDGWYPGRPVMVTENDYALGLFNGDYGIAMQSPTDSSLRVCFMVDGNPRWLHPARLPQHQSVWASTIHKSQGSEYETVVIILPNRDSPVLTREILYTAVTRARSRVDILATRDIIQRTIKRRTMRQSGLSDRLLRGPQDS